MAAIVDRTQYTLALKTKLIHCRELPRVGEDLP